MYTAENLEHGQLGDLYICTSEYNKDQPQKFALLAYLKINQNMEQRIKEETAKYEDF